MPGNGLTVSALRDVWRFTHSDFGANMTDEITNPEAPEAPESPTEADLGDAGKKALAAERRRADQAEKALKALQAEAAERAKAELTELERLKQERDELLSSKSATELQAIRLQVALDKGLPANLAARLQGNDYESISADAESLAEIVSVRPNVPKADLSQGPKADVGPTDPAQQFGQILTDLRRR